LSNISLAIRFNLSIKMTHTRPQKTKRKLKLKTFRRHWSRKMSRQVWGKFVADLTRTFQNNPCFILWLTAMYINEFELALFCGKVQ